MDHPMRGYDMKRLEVLRGFASEHLRGTAPRERARLCSLELRQTFRVRNLRPGALPWI